MTVEASRTTVFEREPADPAVVREALAGSRLTPFWLDGLERPDHAPLAGVVEADLVVVGGGYTGLWTAVLEKEQRPDSRVVLLEAERIGWAASGRNGGFCEASLTHGRENGESRWPDEIERLEELGLENLDQIAATVDRYGMDVDFERTGALTVAVEPHQIDWLGEAAYDADGTRALVDSPTYLAGELDREGCALVHPGKLAVELARVAVELGVVIHERSAVTELCDGGVKTGRGEVRAARTVLATNVFPSLLKRNALMTVPVYDYSLMTEPLSAEQRASLGWEGRQGVADMANQFHYYRLTADDRLLFGGYDAVYHPGRKVKEAYQDRPESYERLMGHLLTTFPQLEGVRISHRWAGAIDTCTRYCAYFGTARKGTVAYAAGFTGLGVGASRFAARVMLDLLSGHETELTRLEMVRERPLPFPPEPLAMVGIGMTQWSLNQADHREGRRNALLRTLDRLGLGFDS
ncbi:FAD-binding oxidoreductase [Demequina capsici]|uniref:FAD-binding oxidoreductase n=1 Tax=Demequina capsici TaxID=3075620 RepID=A0AA96FDS4_9MICO|nr:FAD-binding oxidoreductase [Demequina sp. PMTSA13]WNM28103.1 FAD-binding oxidoreductase [Demequina sp. PMTSA13]